MKNVTGKRILARVSIALMLVCCLCVSVFAEKLPCESATTTAHYRHPATGAIEDSGGESSEALGQGMVESVVDKQAMVEDNGDGCYNLSLRFHLMNNISNIQLAVQKPGESGWQQVSYEKSAQGDDVGDIRFRIPGKDAIIRVECTVDAMGRSVVFFVTLDKFVPGNSGGFTQMEKGSTLGQTPANQQPGASNQQDDTVGLVVGGSKQTPQLDETPSASHEVKEVAITTDVWVMFFFLVFCAQLLACLVFWGIKTLVCDAVKRKKQGSIAQQIAEEPEDEIDFSDDLWKDTWEESENEEK